MNLPEFSGKDSWKLAENKFNVFKSTSCLRMFYVPTHMKTRSISNGYVILPYANPLLG